MRNRGRTTDKEIGEIYPLRGVVRSRRTPMEWVPPWEEA
jgi:hypothetical protein